MLVSRIAEKFGDDVLTVVLAVTKRKLDDHGNEMDRDERNADYLMRIGIASDRAWWVCAADVVHNANAILADLRRTHDPESVWGRLTGGRTATTGWYRTVHDRMAVVSFDAPIMSELLGAVEQLEKAS